MICSNVKNQEEIEVHALRPQHAYTLLDAYTKEVNGKKFHFLKVRNPWGMVSRHYEFNEKMQAFNAIENQENATGEVELNDFFNYFLSYTACNPVKGLTNEDTMDKIQENLFEAPKNK